MSLTEGVGSAYLPRLLFINPLSQSTMLYSTSNSQERTPDTSSSVGTSLRPSIPPGSDSGVSALSTSSLTTTGAPLTSSSEFSFSSMPTPTSLPSRISTMPTSSLSIPYSSTPPDTPSSISSTSPISSVSIATNYSPPPDPTTTVVVPTTIVVSFGSSSAFSPTPSLSTYTYTSFLQGQGGTVTTTVTSSVGLSTKVPENAINSAVPISPGTIAAIVFGIVGAFAFAALWLVCAHRRHRTLVQEAVLTLPGNHAPGPLDDEVLNADDLEYGTHDTRDSTNPTRPAMDERYAGVLAALHLTKGLEGGNEGASTGGIYGSRDNIATDMDKNDNFTRASSPILPPHAISSDDPPYPVPLSPPPPTSPLTYHQATHPILPPAVYNMASRKKGSPGPDAATWLGGYSIAPSCNSHYTRSQTLGSGSGSGSVDALTRTRTGSEEPLLGNGRTALEGTTGASGGVSPTTMTDPGSNKVRLGSAFGSPSGSMYSPSSIHPALQLDTSGSYDARTVSRSGSYGYTRSGTPSSFDVLRSVSSQGALSSAYDHGTGQSQGFRFGSSKPGSSSSTSTGRKGTDGRPDLGVPPTSFKGWKDWGSGSSDKGRRREKRSLRGKLRREKPKSSSSISASESIDEKQERGSPVISVRALLDRFRRGGHTPSPHSSYKDLPSPTKPSMDVDLEKAGADRVASPQVQIQVATPKRRRFSFILSNPDPHSSPPYASALPHREPRPIQPEAPTYHHVSKSLSHSVEESQSAMTFPTGLVLLPAPSPAPTEESRHADGLLHPRLRTQGYSDASLRDFEDYSRPIVGVVKNRLHSTTTFGTQDDAEMRTPSQGTLVQDAATGDEQSEDDMVDVFGAS